MSSLPDVIHNRQTIVTAKPPYDNMGVETPEEVKGVSFHVDYLTFTVWEDYLFMDDLYMLYFHEFFGDLVDQEHGGRFYQRTWRALAGVTFRSDPYDQTQPNRFTVEIPGTACQTLGLETLGKIFQYIMSKASRVTINRIDTAFNHVPFTPRMIYDEFIAGNVKSYIKRTGKSVSWHENAFEVQEDNKTLGTSGVNLGSRTSTRYLRCYDKHGYTRLEVEYKAEKAERVAVDIFLNYQDPENAVNLAMGHLLDYVQFFADWWVSFVDGFKRLFDRLSQSPADKDVEQTIAWLFRQVATAYAFLEKVGYTEFEDALLAIGREKLKKSKRYQSSLSLLSCAV